MCPHVSALREALGSVTVSRSTLVFALLMMGSVPWAPTWQWPLTWVQSHLAFWSIGDILALSLGHKVSAFYFEPSADFLKLSTHHQNLQDL